MGDDRLASAHSTVFIESEDLHGQRTEIEGYDFNKGVDYPRLVSSMVSTGFQASNLGDAIQIVNQMLDWSLADEAIDEDCNEEERDLKYRKSVKCKVFLGFTSNLVSSGIRDTIRYLVEHHMVDVVVSSAGGIEEDLVKCLAPTYRGDFSLPGALLRSKGLNRIGNLLNVLWTPSKLIARLGKEINDRRSYLYWAYKARNQPNTLSLALKLL
ncbi:hypothetical protein ACFX14_026326 [Malus domestica]